MKILPSHTLVDIAFIVCTAMKQAGATVVLSGGGAATFYAPDAYQSRDLDFVYDFWTREGAPEKPLRELGFRSEGNHYRHPDSPYTLDFINEALMIDEEEVTTWNTLQQGDLILNVITPTDCVRDRLLWFMGKKPDYSGLEQAVAVAQRNIVDLDLIEKWMKSQGEADRFEIFKSRLDG